MLGGFQKSGATVICADLNPPQDNSLNFIATDVSNEASIMAMMDQVEMNFGHLDVLVNNAGICIETPIQDTTEQQWGSRDGY